MLRISYGILGMLGCALVPEAMPTHARMVAAAALRKLLEDVIIDALAPEQ